MIFDWMSDPTAWLGLATLVILEIVLGIDNLVFIAILADKLPPHQRNRARMIGLTLAMVMRLGLLASIAWVVTLTQPLFTVLGAEISGRDLILILGGLFLLFKGTMELHERVEGGAGHDAGQKTQHAVFWQVILQIVVLDAVFSLDSVITAVGMVQDLSIMMIAVVVAMAVMMLASRPLMGFVARHPTVVILCLGLLLMIGFSLVAEGLASMCPRAICMPPSASILIELFNQLARRNRARGAHALSRRQRTAQAVLRLLRAGRAGQPTQQADEVAALVDGAGDEPAFAPEESSMIERVLAPARATCARSWCRVAAWCGWMWPTRRRRWCASSRRAIRACRCALATRPTCWACCTSRTCCRCCPIPAPSIWWNWRASRCTYWRPRRC